MIPVVP